MANREQAIVKEAFDRFDYVPRCLGFVAARLQEDGCELPEALRRWRKARSEERTEYEQAAMDAIRALL